MNTANEINTEIDYLEKYRHLNDSEIRDILIKRKSYQEKAATAAIQEAIRRGIIQSEQDLFSEEYRETSSPRFLLFPTIQKQEQKKKILSGIQRINYILGIIPLIFAGINFFDGKIISSVIFACAGVLWLFLNYKLPKTKNLSVISSMFIILCLALGYVIYFVSLLEPLSIMDIAVTIIAFFVSFYCLLFARSLLKN